MARYLVVANQTPGGEQLMNVIRQRLAAGRGSFYVLVPQSVPRRDREVEAVALEVPARVAPPDDAALHRAILTSQARLDQLIKQIRAEGGDAQGDLGNPDPVKAIGTLLAGGERFDEIIISTLPTGMSRWLRMDLPHKVERKYKLPVTTVTAKQAK
jgi:hypothetical protein